MRRIAYWTVGLAFGITVALGLWSCTGSEVLRTEPSQVVIGVEVDGADQVPFDAASWQLSQMTLRPLDPVADRNLGPDPYGLLRSPVALDFTQSMIGLPASPLDDGAYRITDVFFAAANQFNLQNANPARWDDENATCKEKIDEFPGDLTFTFAPTAIRIGFAEGDDPPTVTLTQAEPGTVVMVIDAVPLVDAFLAAFICRDYVFTLGRDSLGRRFIEISGIAEGGQVVITIEGEVVSVDTAAGQSESDVVVVLANAINANPTLQSIGVRAQTNGNRLILFPVTVDVTDFAINDLGLRDTTTKCTSNRPEPVPTPCLLDFREDEFTAETIKPTVSFP